MSDPKSEAENSFSWSHFLFSGDGDWVVHFYARRQSGEKTDHFHIISHNFLMSSSIPKETKFLTNTRFITSLTLRPN